MIMFSSKSIGKMSFINYFCILQYKKVIVLSVYYYCNQVCTDPSVAKCPATCAIATAASSFTI